MGKQIIIGVPGLWETRSDIVKAIASKSGDFIFAGLVLMNTATKDSYTLEVYDRDPGLAHAFEIAGRSLLIKEDIQKIAAHRSTLYVLSSDVSVEDARRMLGVGRALLNAGGLAVKVESTGVAHSAAQWNAYAESNDLFQLYCAFVMLIGGDEYNYSCGMHNFALPDTSVDCQLGLEEGPDLINRFNYFQLAGSPVLADGDTFSATVDAPRYRLKKEICEAYEPDHAFHNPFGRWHLVRAIGNQ